MVFNQLVCYFTIFLAVSTKDYKTPTQVTLCQDFWGSTPQMGLLETQVDSAIEVSSPLLHDKI